MNDPVRPKKQLGQHFLKDLSIAKKIAELIDAKPANVLEIGPGTGVLTQFLLQVPERNLHVVELDGESVVYLKKHFATLEGRIWFEDFLQMDLSKIFGDQAFSLVGNFPYNISSQIFFKMLDHRDQIPLAAGMLQREVAQRLAAGPGTKDYGILSVLLQAWYEVKYHFTVSEEVFSPPPKVKSGVISLRRNQTQTLDCDEKLFVTVVKLAFNQRRKMLRNSLSSLVSQEAILGDYATLRPEQMPVADFLQLTRQIEQSSK